MTQTTPLLSAVIITKNAASSLAQCLASLSFVDEIIVVDSGSTDQTLSIAQRYQARIIHQDWLGFGPQKQFAVNQASHDWVLCLDADEWVSPALANSIQAALQHPMASAYALARCNRFMGRFLRHGEGYPDWCLRLFQRQAANWSDDIVHEYVISQQPAQKLAGDLLHESGEDLAHYLAKQNHYTSLQAQQLQQAGKQIGYSKLVLSPLIRFIKFYLLRRGFLDGIPGLVHISIGCFNSYIKYAKLMELQRTAEAKKT